MQMEKKMKKKKKWSRLFTDCNLTMYVQYKYTACNHIFCLLDKLECIIVQYVQVPAISDNTRQGEKKCEGGMADSYSLPYHWKRKDILFFYEKFPPSIRPSVLGTTPKLSSDFYPRG